MMFVYNFYLLNIIIAFVYVRFLVSLSHSIYLENKLERILLLEHTSVKDVICFKQLLFRQSTLLYNHCGTGFVEQENNSNFIFSYKYNLTIYMMPCKIVKKIPLLYYGAVTWLIIVQRHFYIHFSFFIFEMDDSGKECQYSYLQLVYLSSKHVYCGKRKPFDVYVESNTAEVIFHERFVIKLPNITFHFEIFKQSFDSYFKAASYKQIRNISILTQMFDIYHTRFTKLRWLIDTTIGNNLILQSCYCYKAFIGKVFVYDGPYTMHLLRYVHLTNYTKQTFLNNIITKYYQSLIMLHISDFEYNLEENKLMRCEYLMSQLQTPTLYANSSTHVNSNNSILHKVYRFHRDKIAGVGYMTISFSIRNFSGYNEGGCSLGGFLLRQTVNHKYQHQSTLGPFCFDATPYEPLLTKTGLSELTLSRYTTHLILYAYGPLYNIDIDINLKHSDCEGVLDPIILCRIKEVSIFINNSNYFHFCKTKIGRGSEYEYVYFNIKTCLIFQITKLADVSQYALMLTKTLTVQMEYFFYFNYLYDWTIHTFEEITVVLQDSFLKNVRFKLQLINGIISENNTRTFMLLHKRSNTHHLPVYKLAVYASEIKKQICLTIDADSYDVKDRSALIPITNVCGSIAFQKLISYMLMFGMRFFTCVLYILIERTTTCNKTDILAFSIPNLATHAIYFTEARTIFTIENSNRVMYYQSYGCSEVQVRYNFVIKTFALQRNEVPLKVG